MNSNEIKGAITEEGGKIRSKIGHALGDKEAEARGTADQIKGNVQKNVGKVQDAVKKASNS